MENNKSYMPLFFVLACSLTFTILTTEKVESAYSSSNVTVKKDDGSEIDGPYHPIFPNKSVEVSDSNHPKTDGPLSINYVSSLSFSNQEAISKDINYKSQLETINLSEKKEKVPNFIQISDHRGSNSGWRLSVKQTAPFMNGNHALEGTKILLSNGILSSVSGDDTIAPEVVKSVELKPNDDYKLLLRAKENQGMGTWILRFGKDNEQAPSSVELFVPGDVKKVKGHYQTSLSWQLMDTPAE